MIYLGIDPGLKGGFAFIKEDGTLDLYTMPLIGDKDYDIPEIGRILRSYQSVIAVIEKQHAMPGQGLSSTLKTGLGFGILQSALSVSGISYSVVPAIKWQKNLFVGLPKDQGTKVSSEIVAKRLFPNSDFRKSDRARRNADGLTDAACIAEYCRRNYRNNTVAEVFIEHTPNPGYPDVCMKCGAHIPTTDASCF